MFFYTFLSLFHFHCTSAVWLNKDIFLSNSLNQKIKRLKENKKEIQKNLKFSDLIL